jgi:hypothetical protein
MNMHVYKSVCIYNNIMYLDGPWEAAVHAEDVVVDHGAEGQAVEHLVDRLPHLLA